MSTEYGLVTRDMAEKEILKVLNDKLKYFFTEAANKNYDIYTSYTLSKYSPVLLQQYSRLGRIAAAKTPW